MLFSFSSLELIIITLVLSFTFTILSLPFILKIGNKYNIFDKPSSRKQPKKILVRIGGLAMVIAFTLSIYLINALTNNLLFDNNNLVTIVISSFLIFFIGFTDDIFSLSAFIRLVIQIIIALWAWKMGLRIDNIDISWIDIPKVELTTFLSSLITTLWLVGITNAVNWLDGLDGLAAGITGFAGIGLTIISFQNGQILEPIIAASISGCSFGFLKYNFFPAKLLMGDGGSYFLGFLLASVSLLSTNSENNAIGILVPVLLLLLPITDLVTVIFSRIKRGKSPLLADRKHIHHRFLNKGLSELAAVINIYGISQWITVLTITLASKNSGIYILLFMFSSLLLFLTTVLSKFIKY